MASTDAAVTPIMASEDAIRATVQRVVRAYRDAHPEPSPRPFLTEIAWFLVHAMSLPPSHTSANVSPASSEEIVTRCIRLLKLKDSPVVETIQLQVSIHALTFMKQMKLSKEEHENINSCDDILSSALNIQVYDRRDIFEKVDQLHKLLVDFLKETSKRVDEDMKIVSHNEGEISAALDSIFPRTGFLYWINLSDVEKVSQLQELSNIVPGIRTYNRLKGKGTVVHQTEDIFHIFDEEAKTVKNIIEDELKNIIERATSYAQFITSHLDTLGTQHVLIQRLRDELHYDLQLSSFFQDLCRVVREMQKKMEKLSGKFREQLEILDATIGSHNCVPNELIFPEFQNIGLLQKRASKNIRKLRTQSEIAQELCILSSNPAFKRTPFGLAQVTTDGGVSKLEIIVDNCEFLPSSVYKIKSSPASSCHINHGNSGATNVILVKNIQNLGVENIRLQLNGYCIMTMLKNGGLLLSGDPKAGVAQVGEKKFIFCNTQCLNEFVKAPGECWAALEAMIAMKPQLVNILGLQREEKFRHLALPHILELVNKYPLKQEFSTQTAVHIQPEHVFDEESFYKRVLQLASKKTHSTQTNSSHFHRDSHSQVWLPRDKSTQSLFNEGTTMPRRLKIFENLRGPPHFKFNVVEVILDV